MKRLQEHRHALGSEAYLTLVLNDDIDQDLIFVGLWAQIEKFEAKFSRFQPTSELTRLNHQAGQHFQVTPEFKALVVVAQAQSAKTNGLYNPFVLPNLQRAGYAGSWPTVQDGDVATNFKDRDIVPVEKLQIGSDWVEIPEGSALDFGGIGKGYLLDQLADWLDRQGIIDYSLSLGGDIAFSGHDVTGQNWEVTIQAADALTEKKDVGRLTGTAARRQAVATSGITKRRGTGWHHIINPTTGVPADTDVLSATVVTERAVDADVAAKCAVIGGTSDAERLLSKLGCTGSLLQCVDLQQTRILTTGVITKL